MNPFIRIIEILVLVVLPLLLFYLRSSWLQKEIYINVTFLPLLWYVFYAPIHELGHIVGCLLVGLEIRDYQLFSHFWEGSFGFAFVDIKEGYGENMKSFVVLLMPYFLDLISVIIGYFILLKYKIKNSFIVGIVFLILCVRPIYDLADNFIGYFLNHSDFVLASRIVGKSIVFTFVISSLVISVTLTLFLLKKYNHYPSIEIEK